MSATTTERGPVIETMGGRYFNLADPQPEEVNLFDISVALSNQARFNGLTNQRYSIAEHAILTMRLVIAAGHPELALPALHHDSHEAYMGDLTTPFKRLVDEQAPGLIAEIANKLDDAIGRAFDIDPRDFKHPVVKAADREALRQEARVLKYSGGVGEHWGRSELPEPLPHWEPGLASSGVASLFRILHRIEPEGIAAALAKDQTAPLCMARFKDGPGTYICELESPHDGACQAPAVDRAEGDA